jgi:hypothetical protein
LFKKLIIIFIPQQRHQEHLKWCMM